MIASSAIAPLRSDVSMLSRLATRSAEPCPVWTLADRELRAHARTHVDASRTRRDCVAVARNRDRLAARLLIERAVPRRHRTHARRAQSRRHAGEHRLHHLRDGLDEDDPSADLVHERAETETDA